LILDNYQYYSIILVTNYLKELMLNLSHILYIQVKAYRVTAVKDDINGVYNTLAYSFVID